NEVFCLENVKHSNDRTADVIPIDRAAKATKAAHGSSAEPILEATDTRLPDSADSTPQEVLEETGQENAPQIEDRIQYKDLFEDSESFSTWMELIAEGKKPYVIQEGEQAIGYL